MESYAIIIAIVTILIIYETNGCNHDSDCGHRQFCLEENCQECFDCGLLYRANLSCAKSSFECGQCLHGYKEILLTSSALPYKKACQPIDDPPCRTDADCPGHAYCYIQRACLPCLECSAHLRHPSSTTSCPKVVEDCGLCLPGYQDVPVTEGSAPKPCQESVQPLISQNTEVNINIGAITVFGATVLVIVCLALFYCARRSHSKELPTSRRIEENPQPPPYVSGDEEEEIPSQESTIVCGYVKERPDMECMARIFRLPDYARSGGRNPPPPPDPQDDEETVPCSWRPCRDDISSVVGENGALNFTGRIPQQSAETITDLTDSSPPGTEQEPSEPSRKRRKSP